VHSRLMTPLMPTADRPRCRYIVRRAPWRVPRHPHRGRRR